MFNTALVIIDMQRHFSAARNRSTIRHCIKLIKKAKKDNIPIIALEYVDYFERMDMGETLPKLKKHLDNYELTRYVKKNQNDGSHSVISCLQKNGWTIDKFLVCGVNINACVAQTVHALVNDYNKAITVFKKACNGSGLKRRAFTVDDEKGVYKDHNVTLV